MSGVLLFSDKMAAKITKRILNARLIDFLMSLFCVGFMGSLIFINLYLTSNLSKQQEMMDVAVSAR